MAIDHRKQAVIFQPNNVRVCSVTLILAARKAWSGLAENECEGIAQNLEPEKQGLVAEKKCEVRLPTWTGLSLSIKADGDCCKAWCSTNH